MSARGFGGRPDRDEVLKTLRRLPDLGVDFIDTADSYGPNFSEELIREALAPYGKVHIATKGGLTRTGQNIWIPLGRPEYLIQQAHTSRWRLGVEIIDLWQLHRIDPKVPAKEQFDAIASLIKDKVIRCAGLSEVSVAEIEAASKVFPVATVQNRYNFIDRNSEDALDYCEKHSIGFIPWAPLDAGASAKPGSALDAIAHKHKASPGQIALAWLLKRSPVMLPIPGTGKVAHLEENVAAAAIKLTDEEFATLDRVGRGPSDAMGLPDKDSAGLAPEHGAGAADGLDPSAKLARFAAGLGGQADAVERPPAAAAQDGAEHERLHVADHACIFMPGASEGAQRRAFREARGDLHAPGREPARDDGRGRRHAQGRDEAQAGRTFVRRRLGGRLVAPPLVGVVTRDGEHVILRFERKRALLGEPTGDRRGACVIGSRRQTQIAEAELELVQEPRGSRDRGCGIERIDEPALARGPRHELGDPLRARGADRGRPERTLPPDELGEEVGRQPLRLGGGFDDPA